MKKIPLLLIFIFLVSACSMSVDQLVGSQPTPLSASIFTNTPTIAPSATSTVPSPTFTTTPTMVGIKTKTLVPEVSPTYLILTPLDVTPLPSSTPLVLVPQVKMTGFVSVSVSAEEFYKGKECLPPSVTFTAHVSDAGGTAFVVLFVRFKSKQTGVTSEWTSIGMQTGGIPGIYKHELVPLEMKAVKYFENAWVQYQFVATDSNSNQVGRTDIFDERLTLLECVITPTPSPSVTPTKLVP